MISEANILNGFYFAPMGLSLVLLFLGTGFAHPQNMAGLRPEPVPLGAIYPLAGQRRVHAAPIPY